MAVLGAVLQAVGTDVAGPAGAPVVATGIAAYTPYSLLASGSTMPTSSFQVETRLPVWERRRIDPASLTVVNQPASGTPPLPTTRGFLAWTPTTSAAGTRTSPSASVPPGLPPSASNASCTMTGGR